MNATEKMQRAKIQLILNQPFFATLAMGFKYEENHEIKTGDIDGITMRYNPKFVDGLTQSKTVGFVAHETMHPAMMHHTRRNGRNPSKWNRACDYAINQMLIDSGFDLPDGALLNPAYKDMTAEKIYSLLPDEPGDNDKGGDKDSGGTGGVKDAPAKTDVEMRIRETEAKQMLQKAVMAGKKAGTIPKAFEHMIQVILTPRVNWKDQLAQFLTERCRNDYTFARPSNRYLWQGLYLPSLQSIEKGKFILVVDSSCSVDDEKLNEFGSDMQSILSEVAESVTVYYVDTKVNNVQEFEGDDDMQLHCKGRGGTDFRPAFHDVEKNGIECAALVYFTDGDCDRFPADPGYPVLWAIYGDVKFNPPFGEVIRVD